MKHTKCYKKDYPRPMFVRKSWTNLNGEWDFCFDRQNSGESLKYYNGFTKEKTINVPFAYQSKDSGIFVSEHIENVWYQKKVFFEKKDGHNLYLNLEGSDYHTKVWVNGLFVGENKGAYSRFSININSAIIDGENLIVIKVSDSYSCRQPRGKQRWLDENFACWYKDIVGIWKTVWAEYLPKTYLKEVKVESNYDENCVRLVGKIEGDYKSLKVRVKVEFENKTVYDGVFNIFDDVFYCTVDFTGAGHHLKRWTPEKAELYDVEYFLIKENQIVDYVGSYFGIVKYSADKNVVLANNKPIYLKMILDQGYFGDNLLTPPSEDAVLKDIQNIIDAGFNGVRKHQKIEIEQFYYYCDILGLYAWCEMPSPYVFDDHMIYNTTSQWLKIVNQLGNHPSIMAFIPFNESWGFDNIKDNVRAQNYAKSIYYLTKSIRPERLVVANDGWENVVGDLATLHCYSHDAEKIEDYLKDLQDVMDNKANPLPMLRQVYSNGHSYEGQPIIISECCGIAFDKSKGTIWGYGGVKTQEEFINKYDAIISTIKGCKKISGYCVTQLTDIEQEINGLLTEDRIWKVDINRIKEINVR